MDTSKINHPPHYTAAPIECIEAIEAALGKEAFIDFCRGQAIKYLWRARLKDTLQENLQKAQWYIHKALLEIKQ
ncbi:SaV-like [uncultured Caudovirales phage]|uniref:SaV-like n=1 Tax=uncultured Caudovirales phage TaxID=2100421 RepID=A0A6J5P5G1_9CAUD|nr:SaV-like [uncultured Caudovirales phage]